MFTSDFNDEYDQKRAFGQKWEAVLWIDGGSQVFQRAQLQLHLGKDREANVDLFSVLFTHGLRYSRQFCLVQLFRGRAAVYRLLVAECHGLDKYGAREWTTFRNVRCL